MLLSLSGTLRRRIAEDESAARHHRDDPSELSEANDRRGDAAD
jgi:hypothetical protein